MEELKQRVFRFLQKEGLIPGETDEKGRKMLVGVSGGADSVCLLHILDQLKGILGISLHVAHLNHMLRGVDSDSDAHYVAEISGTLGIPAIIEKRDVEVYRKEHRLSLEEAAREVRHVFFAEVAESIGAWCITLGHTQDDQVETILMHLVRGTGLGGLRGMGPITSLRLQGDRVLVVVRPLLEVAKKETEDYCRTYDLKPRSDSSNYSFNYTRNRFRGELIPLLKSYNKNFDAALMRTARAVAADLSFIEKEVSMVWDRVVTDQPNGLTLDREALLSLHPALQRHLLRRAVGEVLGDLVDIQSIHVEKMIEALSKPAGKRLSLPRGTVFYIGYDSCMVTKGVFDSCPFPALEGEYRLNVPGDTVLSGWRVTASVTQHGSKTEGFRASLDLDEAGSDLVVRGRKAGDRFQPLGMSESKKLQDFMVDAKIARSWRDCVPLVCSESSILWVVGWRIADQVKVTDRTKRVLRLEFEKL
ncbi:MAG: tRNA lysidine(34) synthetase TilS [Dehalococcoidia bacterium]|nr:tRNA lysidine(34) synthetase TilS [Dehalococcoidia bacterium]